MSPTGATFPWPHKLLHHTASHSAKCIISSYRIIEAQGIFRAQRTFDLRAVLRRLCLRKFFRVFVVLCGCDIEYPTTVRARRQSLLVRAGSTPSDNAFEPIPPNPTRRKKTRFKVRAAESRRVRRRWLFASTHIIQCIYTKHQTHIDHSSKIHTSQSHTANSLARRRIVLVFGSHRPVEVRSFLYIPASTSQTHRNQQRVCGEARESAT